MYPIQSVSIPRTSLRQSPSPHTVYEIHVSAPVRTWSTFHRYSSFDALHADLTSSTGSAPPAPLPPKHALSLFGRKGTDPAVVEERRLALERYLRAILADKDARWRESQAFRVFLGIPSSASSSSGAGPSSFSSSSWLEEHATLQSSARTIRSLLAKRDALLTQGSASASSAHATGLEAKKALAALLTRLGQLAVGLEGLGRAGMPEGELRRRGDLVSRLQDEAETLGKLVVAARSAGALSSRSRSPSPPPTAQRAELFASSSSAFSALSSSSLRPGRVLGRAPSAPPQETAQTRPLDNAGVLHLHRSVIDQQDEQLKGLSAILARQKMLGVAIGAEIEGQNEMLDGLTEDVDRFGGKLGRAKKQMDKLQGKK